MNCTSGCGGAGAEPPVEGVTPLDAPSAQPVQAGDGVGSTDLVPLPTVEGPEDVGPSPTPFPMPIVQRPPEDGGSESSCRCAGEKAERKCRCCCCRRRDDEREPHPLAIGDALRTGPGLDLSQATPLTAGQGGSGARLREISSPPPLVPTDATQPRRALAPGMGMVAAARILDRREGLFASGGPIYSFPPTRKVPPTLAAPDSVASSFGIRDLAATAAPMVVDEDIAPPEDSRCCCAETSERRSEAECCCCRECDDSGDGNGDGDGAEAPSLPPPDGSEIVPRDTAPTGSGEGPAGEIAPYSRRPAGPIYAPGGGLYQTTPVGTIVGRDVCEVGEYGTYVSPEGNRYWGCPFNPTGVYGPTPAAAAAQGMMFFPTQSYADDPAGWYLGGTYVNGLWVATAGGYVPPAGGYGDSLSAYIPQEPSGPRLPPDLGKSKYPLASPPDSTWPGAPDYLYITIGNPLPLQSRAPPFIPQPPVGYTFTGLIHFHSVGPYVDSFTFQYQLMAVYRQALGLPPLRPLPQQAPPPPDDQPGSAGPAPGGDDSPSRYAGQRPQQIFRNRPGLNAGKWRRELSRDTPVVWGGFASNTPEKQKRDEKCPNLAKGQLYFVLPYRKWFYMDGRVEKTDHEMVEQLRERDKKLFPPEKEEQKGDETRYIQHVVTAVVSLIGEHRPLVRLKLRIIEYFKLNGWGESVIDDYHTWNLVSFLADAGESTIDNFCAWRGDLTATMTVGKLLDPIGISGKALRNYYLSCRRIAKRALRLGPYECPTTWNRLQVFGQGEQIIAERKDLVFLRDTDYEVGSYQYSPILPATPPSTGSPVVNCCPPTVGVNFPPLSDEERW